MRCPWIVCSGAPRVPFGVLHCKFAAAVGSFLQRTHHPGPSRLCTGICGIHIGNHEIHTARLNAGQLFGRLEPAAILIVLDGSEHDHPSTQSELRVNNASVFTLIDGVLDKAKNLGKKRDCGSGISIAMPRNYSTAFFSHGDLRRQSSPVSLRRTIKSVILGGMGLPPADAELVQIIDAAFADAARRAGPFLVCKPGCTQCCHGAFAINALDAQRLATGMEILRTNNPTLAADLQRRGRIWLYEHGPTFPGDPRTGILGETEIERERFEGYANQAACPALNPATGLCDIYEWRPMTCRVFGPPIRIDAGDEGRDPEAENEETHALGHCELCFIGATTAEVAACEMPIQYEYEQTLLAELPTQGETIVAFALLR